MTSGHALTAQSDFKPSFWLRHHQIQSILATKSPRRRLWLKRGSQMETVAKWHVLEADSGVRLTGMHSPQANGSRGLCVLIHGWEGSHDSVYLYSMACALYDAGYSVFRLNLRDHSGTHALNEELFHSARMTEVLDAIRAAQTLDGASPLYVVGFSLGGNFALRVGLQGPAQGVTPKLSVGISPAVNPGHTLRAIDEGPPLFRLYFLNKWRKTLRAKKAAWPRYDFSDLQHHKSFIEITRDFVLRYTEYGSLENYLAQYTVTPAMLMDAPAPVAVITARDDAVIPFHYFDGLAARGSVRAFLATRYGGHCGFIENLGLSCWAEERVLELLKTAD